LSIYSILTNGLLTFHWQDSIRFWVTIAHTGLCPCDL